MTVEEAIRLHTEAPAYFTFDEAKKGRIEEGMLADFVILSDDILSVDPERIREIRVEETYVGGRRTHGG